MTSDGQVPNDLEPGAEGAGSRPAVPEQLRVRKPDNLDLARLQPDLQKAFPLFAKAGLRAVFRQGKAEEALIEGISSLGLKVATTPGERAWLLLTRALARAAARTALTILMTDYDGPEMDWQGPLSQLGTALVVTLDAALQQEPYVLTPALLDQPRQVPGLIDCRAPLAAWLRESQFFLASQADEAAAQLPEQFVYALYDEWAAHPADYKPIEEALHGGAAPAAQREWAWARYRAHLQAEYQKPLFGTESFGAVLRLPEMYVDLRAWYVERSRSAPGRRGEPEPETQKRHVVRLEETLDAWLSDRDASRVRVLGGGPGAGKSSFLKRYAARIAARRERPVVLVELHLADLDGDLSDLVTSYLRGSGLLEHDPLDRKEGEPNLLVILDGLDELERSGRPGQAAARGVLKEVRRFTELRQTGGGDVRVLLSGRELVVAAVSEELQSPEQVLHLLPYHLPEPGNWHDPTGLLAQDQRVLWWEKLRARTDRAVTMPRGLDEITAEPLLNYLVALAQASGRLPEGDGIVLNQVYEALVLDVWERPWGSYRGPKPQKEEFFAVLEETALATWHGDGKGATVKEIRTYCEDGGLGAVLDALQAGAEAGVTSLLVSFFFRRRDRNAEHECTFEFTHKSFAEYLLARRLAFALERIHEKRSHQSRSSARRKEGWTIPEALLHWADLCGPTLLTLNAAEFLHGEVALRKKEAADWQPGVLELVNTCLAAGGLTDAPPRAVNFPEMQRQSRNAEAALLVGACACSLASGRPYTVLRLDEDAFGNWLRMFEAVGDPLSLVAWAGLRNLDLEGAFLGRVELSGARLEGAKLSGAVLSGASLIGARMDGVLLRRADLSRVLMFHTNLDGAKLDGANLAGAILDGANLARASLDGASLSNTRYDDRTVWPKALDPESRGAVKVERQRA